MTDPYKTAFNIQNGIAIEIEDIKAMADELQKVKWDYEEQNRKLGGLKQSIREHIGIADLLGRQNDHHYFEEMSETYESVLRQMKHLGI